MKFFNEGDEFLLARTESEICLDIPGNMLNKQIYTQAGL
jgi:hypothetical protein